MPMMPRPTAWQLEGTWFPEKGEPAAGAGAETPAAAGQSPRGGAGGGGSSSVTGPAAPAGPTPARGAQAGAAAAAAAGPPASPATVGPVAPRGRGLPGAGQTHTVHIPRTSGGASALTRCHSSADAASGGASVAALSEAGELACCYLEGQGSEAGGPRQNRKTRGRANAQARIEASYAAVVGGGDGASASSVAKPPPRKARRPGM
jgi:hypothetical protein